MMTRGRTEEERFVDEMRDRFDRVDNEEMMRNPQRWPYGHRLPLKRRADQTPCCGYLTLTDDFRVEPVVTTTDRVQERRYASFEDLIADGWRVD